MDEITTMVILRMSNGWISHLRTQDGVHEYGDTTRSNGEGNSLEQEEHSSNASGYGTTAPCCVLPHEDWIL